jgi:CysZ protein
MLNALMRAAAQVFTPPLRRIVGISLALALAALALSWLAAGFFLYRMAAGWGTLGWLVELLGGIAVLGLTWLLFPAIVTLVMSFYLDRVAAAVEALDYPGRGPPRRAPFGETALVVLRLMAATVLLNLLALPVYLFVPGINLILFLALNGYLFGRGYFEVVALRRLDAAAAKAMRRRHGGRVFLGGVVIAGLFALPLVNLVAPVIATAFMVHLFEGLPQAEAYPLSRSVL